MNKFHKKAFTLSELLVTLTVVGVIAAITVPQVAVSVNKNKTATVLARGVEQLQTGCRHILQTANENTTDGSFYEGYSQVTDGKLFGSSSTNSISGTSMVNIAGSFFGLRRLDNNSKYSMSDYSGTASTMFENAKTGVHEKMGIYMSFLPVTSVVTTEEDPIIDVVAIDTNGASAPNRYGRDIFAVGLTDKCMVVPAGLKRMQNALSTEIPLSENGCQAGNVTDGLSCTAKIVHDGYKINY